MAVVTRLRDPGGCPWDQEQTHISLRQHLLEETYETLEAIESGDPRKLAEELGDLLTHIAFHADMARRAGEFTEAELFSGVIAKLVRRHPHVFGGGPKLGTSEEVLGQWEDLKRKEGGRDSIADGVPGAMPALAYAAALQRRAAKAGLTWDGQASFRTRKGKSSAAEEARAGDYLWAVVRRLQDAGVDPETALRVASLKFRDRIRRAEKLAEGRPLADVPARERARLWKQAEDR
jgi:MazG family protein